MRAWGDERPPLPDGINTPMKAPVAPSYLRTSLLLALATYRLLSGPIFTSIAPSKPPVPSQCTPRTGHTQWLAFPTVAFVSIEVSDKPVSMNAAHALVALLASVVELQ